MHEHTQLLRTAIYIDGYNLYYGRLRGIQYKWLDVVALFSQIIRTIDPNVFSKILGTHSYEKDGTALPVYVEGQAFDRANRVKVWRLVEKKTDVNLAMAMYRDAMRQRVDQVVLVSNDSDAEPVIFGTKSSTKHYYQTRLQREKNRQLSRPIGSDLNVFSQA